MRRDICGIDYKNNLGIPKLNNFSFGATSAIMTSLAIIVGLSTAHDAKITIMTALLIIAVADNISDSLGIHVYQESQNISAEEVRKTTTNNFFTRLIITLIFILFIMMLPINFAVILSIMYGVMIIIILSYLISRDQEVNPYSAIFQHLAIAVIVVVASFFLRELITKFI